jgi:deoxyribodipyrimidine photolyase-related protein
MDTTSVWIPGDQLLVSHPALNLFGDRNSIQVLLIESRQRTRKLPYQRKKLVLLFSAMRHYAEELQQQGYNVDYVKAVSFEQALKQHITRHNPAALVAMSSASYRGLRFQKSLGYRLGLPVTILPNSQFLVGRFNPIPEPEADRRYVMEEFYRQMRRHFGLLMENGDPLGGQWNFDKENRKPLPESDQPPVPVCFAPDATTRKVMAEVVMMPEGIGTVDGFNYAVNRHEALVVLKDFLNYRLPRFGDYEDALTSRSHVVYHSQLSPYLNLGLLEPLEIATAAEAAYHEGFAPLNAVEGFIRQIIGWREFMFWQYWRQMPGLEEKNSWHAERPLPGFVWNGQTDMACMRFAITRALDNGYNHHIERLMLLCNFFMLAGINPRLVNDWFLSLYIDAYEWVMPPNVMGMGLNADGGLTATKPYIASANYINRMGDHCAHCHYDPRLRHGQQACPFNYLYWNFIMQHEDRLLANPRTSRNVWGLRHLNKHDRSQVKRQAEAFLNALDD